MNLVSIRIITGNIQEMVKFYEHVTGLSVIQYTPDFAEIKMANATIAIASTKTLAFFGGDSLLRPAQNHSTIIEFKVDNLEKEYERLADFLRGSIVQSPTTMPWRNKSLLFLDPDGNLVDFFTPVTPEARAKFDGK